MEVRIAELKDRLSELIDRAEHGEPVTVTRHGRPVVTMAPARTRPTREEVERVFEEIRRDGHKLPPLTDDEVVSAIRADRRY